MGHGQPVIFSSQGKLNVDTAVVYAKMFAYCKENKCDDFDDFDVEHDPDKELSVQDYKTWRRFSVL